MSDASPYAPIVLFTYNRPEHTRRTLESLHKNDLAASSDLIVYQDGPKDPGDADLKKKIEEVELIVQGTKWCKTLDFRKRDKNLGVDASILQGVSAIVSERKKVIVLEDDLELSPGFLRFMNDALTLYEEEKMVKQVGGYSFPVKTSLPDTFLLKGYAESWGWGTWQRAWDELNEDAHQLFAEVTRSPEQIRRFNFDHGYDFLGMLRRCAETDDHPWDIRFFATIFLNQGFVLLPGESLVQNIGLDGSGVHCGDDPYYVHDTLADMVKVERLPMREDVFARPAYENFFKSLKPDFVDRVKDKLLSYVAPGE
jgi:hypothetical protein